MGKSDISMVEYVGLKKANVSGLGAEVAEALSRTGYYVLENAIDANKVQEIKDRVIQVWKKQEVQFGGESLRKIGEYGVARSLLEYDFHLSQLLVHPTVSEILAATVGETAILHLMNGILLFPDNGHSQRRLHRDFSKDFISSKILSVNIFVMLDDFTASNGSTEYLPGSHRDELIPSDGYIRKNIVSVSAPKGSLLIFDSLLLHRTGINSTSQERVGLNMQFTRPFVKQQIDYPNFFKADIDPDSQLAQRLGYWSVSPKGVAEYRVQDPRRRTYRAGQG